MLSLDDDAAVRRLRHPTEWRAARLTVTPCMSVIRGAEPTTHWHQALNDLDFYQRLLTDGYVVKVWMETRPVTEDTGTEWSDV